MLNARRTDAPLMINAHRSDVARDPFPHVLTDQLLEPSFFRRLDEEFPTQAEFQRQAALTGKTGSRTGTGFDLYRGDEGFRDLLKRSPAWREFHAYLNSSQFMDDTLSVFSDYLAEAGCLFDPKKARHIDYAEPREVMTERESLVGKVKRISATVVGQQRVASEDTSVLFTRCDIHSGAADYRKPVHCDRSNRLVSLVLYFSDAEKIGMEGGELTIHRHKKKMAPTEHERHPREQDTEVVATIPNKPNRAVFFLCSNNSYHAVNSVVRTSQPRRFAYINLTSKAGTLW